VASDSEIGDVVTAMVAAVNRGDFASAISAFTTDAVIVEDIAPFRWRGPSAVLDWLAAMGANAEAVGATAIEMQLGEAERVEARGGHAYALIRGVLRMATPTAELRANGLLTLVLHHRFDGWLIDTLVWSGGAPA
jgi:ketosteroid isomerase-like protein